MTLFTVPVLRLANMGWTMAGHRRYGGSNTLLSADATARGITTNPRSVLPTPRFQPHFPDLTLFLRYRLDGRRRQDNA